MIIIMLEFMLILSLFWGKFSDWEIRKRGGVLMLWGKYLPISI